MDEHEIRQVQTLLGVTARAVMTMRLEEFLAALEMAETVGPFVDPTAWIAGSDNMQQWHKLAKALKAFQDVAREVFPDEAVATSASKAARRRDMSWWVYLEDASGEPVKVEAHEEGGTHALGGIPCAELNITYNYSPRFCEAWDGLGLKEALHGKKAADVTALLERGVQKLGDALGDDYWKATPGNAGHALAVLLGWARQHPEAVFRIS